MPWARRSRRPGTTTTAPPTPESTPVRHDARAPDRPPPNAATPATPSNPDDPAQHPLVIAALEVFGGQVKRIYPKQHRAPRDTTRTTTEENNA
jgi:hypothetical protein